MPTFKFFRLDLCDHIATNCFRRNENMDKRKEKLCFELLCVKSSILYSGIVSNQFDIVYFGVFVCKKIYSIVTCGQDWRETILRLLQL